MIDYCQDQDPALCVSLHSVEVSSLMNSFSGMLGDNPLNSQLGKSVQTSGLLLVTWRRDTNIISFVLISSFVILIIKQYSHEQYAPYMILHIRKIERSCVERPNSAAYV